jgi:predicted amidohydrolase
MMSGKKVRAAALQLTSGADPTTNVKNAVEMTFAAISAGAEYIQFPEYFNYLGPEENYPDVAETIPGPTTDRFGEIAREKRVVIHIGSMLEKSPDPSKCYNTSVVLDSTGSIAATYRKGHLFDINVTGEVEYQESATIAPGKQLVVVELPGFTLGLSICFDLRFPEIYRQLAVNGATILAVPAAFAVPTGRAHWETLLRARAIENHAFVIAAGQSGTTAEGISTYGHTMIVGPWGEVLAESQTENTELVTATLDMDDVTRRRSQIAVFDLRRPELYNSLPNSIGDI